MTSRLRASSTRFWAVTSANQRPSLRSPRRDPRLVVPRPVIEGDRTIEDLGRAAFHGPRHGVQPLGHEALRDGREELREIGDVPSDKIRQRLVQRAEPGEGVSDTGESSTSPPL